MTTINIEHRGAAYTLSDEEVTGEVILVGDDGTKLRRGDDLYSGELSTRWEVFAYRETAGFAVDQWQRRRFDQTGSDPDVHGLIDRFFGRRGKIPYWLRSSGVDA